MGLDDVAWQVPPTYDDGQMLLAAAEQQGLEGIVSKRLSSRYRPGVRSREWLKFPIRPTGSFVVGGYRHEVGSDQRLGAVLVGQPTATGLAFRGRVGSGIAGKAGRLLAELLDAARRRRLAVRHRAARGSTVTAPSGSSRSSSSTCSTCASRTTDGCANRRTVASARTSAPRTWSDLT